jgi:hypothetical protein
MSSDRTADYAHVSHSELHSDDFESSGARVKDISAPLAREGISIFFLATRNSDFLLCKEHRLDLVLALLQQNGFHYISEPDDTDDWPSAAQSYTNSPATKRSHSPTRSASVTGSVVLTRSITLSTSASPARKTSFEPMASSTDSLREVTGERGRSTYRERQETSETILGDLLADTDACGSERGRESLDLPVDPDAPEQDSGEPRSFPSQAYPPDANLSAALLASSVTLLADELVCVGLAPEHENVWREKLLRALFYCEDVLPPSEVAVEVEEDDEPAPPRPRLLSGMSASLASLSSSAATTTPRPNTPASRPASRTQEAHPDVLMPTDAAGYPTPFLGFTQTSDGASLTADIRLLRALFSPAEEGELIYSAGDGGLSGPWVDEHVHTASRATNGAEAVDSGRRLLKCLQLDLSQFGLDKFGIVNSFADLLTGAGASPRERRITWRLMRTSQASTW